MAANFETEWNELTGKIASIIGTPLKSNRRANKGILDSALAEIVSEDEAQTVATVKAALLKARELDKTVDETIRGLLSKKKELVKIHKQLEAWSQGKEPAPEQGEQHEQ